MTMTIMARKMFRSFFAQFDYPLNKWPDGQVTLFPDALFKETARRARKDGSFRIYKLLYMRC